MVYTIKSELTGRIYIGQTNDIKRRLQEHNGGIVRSTKIDRPWQIVAIEEVLNRNEARWIEKCLKNSHRKKARWLEKNKILSNMVYAYNLLG
jgi:putative endonuclease